MAALGADEVVAPGEEAAYGPYDVVLELVGTPSLTAALPALATGARVVVIGVGGGAQIDLNLFLLMRKRARLGGSTLRSRSRSEKASVAAAVAHHVLPLLASGRIERPGVRHLPVSPRPQTAYERFARGREARQGGPRRFAA